MENCRTQDIQSEVAAPQAPTLRNLFAQYVGTENCQTQDIETEAADSQAPCGTFITVEKCRTQDIQSEAGDSQASLRAVWSEKMADPGQTPLTHWHSNRPGPSIFVLQRAR